MHKLLKYLTSAAPSETVQMTKLVYGPFNCMKTLLFYIINGVN